MARLLIGATLGAIVASFSSVPKAPAQELSIQCYDASSGLAHSSVHSIYQDSKGYVWIATDEGVSRFDGYRFTNYSIRDGLGHLIINAITEDHQKRIWVATNGGGVSRFMDAPAAVSATWQVTTALPARRKFLSFPVGDSPESNRVNAFVFSSDEMLWCATDAGLYRTVTSSADELRFSAVVPNKPVTESMAAFADNRGRLWFGIVDNLVEVVAGHLITYGPTSEIGHYRVRSVTEDRNGRLLAANTQAVFEFLPPANEAVHGSWQKLPILLTPEQSITRILADPGGSLWVGTTNGLIKYKDKKQAVFTTSQGLSHSAITDLIQDRDGNLWLGTDGGGVCKMTGEMIVSFNKTEGISNQMVHQIIVDRKGSIYAVTNSAVVGVSDLTIAPMRGTPVRLVQDCLGDWWEGRGQALFRYPGPSLQFRNGERLGPNNGIPRAGIAAMYEDPLGNLWVSLWDAGLYRSDPTRMGHRLFQRVSLGPAWPSGKTPSVMMRGRAGEVWLGGQGVLAKFDGVKSVIIGPDDGLPETEPRAFLQDSRGWLWIGLRYRGVSMTKEPAADHPRFVNYSTENGLTSNSVWSIVEDDRGRLYFGTGRGLDRLEVSSGRIHHFLSAEGMAESRVLCSARDPQGNIWVGCTTGLSKLDPKAESVLTRPPPVYVSRLQIAGSDAPWPETGVTLAPQLELPASLNNVLIEYVGLDFRSERALRYQYRLDGADNTWGGPTEQRSVNYARLAPGAYRFQVRAINRNGIASNVPAMIQFRILPPVWQRWWFIALAAVLTAAAAYSLYRFRVERLVQLERVRTRIATDLHDDIGSDLSLIAMVSEIARSQIGPGEKQLREWLSLIATTSHELVDSMNDIVWAVNPKRDRLRDLTMRMRRFADDAFSARGIVLDLHAPDVDQDIMLDPEVRREVFLIFKEGINNIVRHSGCAQGDVEFTTEGGWLVLKMADNGKGFDPSLASQGNGLASMRKRAGKLRGSLEVGSCPGKGTTVTLKVPLGGRL